MVEIKKAKSDYRQCQSCGIKNIDSENQVFDISVGFDDHQMSTLSLCIDCIELIKVK